MLKKLKKITRIVNFFLIPSLTIIISLFAEVFPFRISNFSLFIPLFLYITLYYWITYRPRAVPYLFVFFIGLLKDILNSNIWGLSSLCLLFFQILIKSQRKYIYNRVFVVVWSGFMFSLALMLLIPLILDKFTINVISIQWLISVLAYVPIHWLLNKLDNYKA